MVAFAFAATEIELEAVTAAGRSFFAGAFGGGAVSVRLPKSELPGFAAYAAKARVTIG